jgi:23S rRNA (adenine1618-N6)-methyltransferase
MNFLNKKRRTDFNDKMHPENKYFENPPDFKLLAEKYPEFNKYVFQNKYGSYSINWKDKNASKELTRTLLLEDFNLNYWDIPDGYLIPSITSRCNYIHWIKDLLELEEFQLNEKDKIIGLDIGTGANCIYPLLGHQIYNWEFKATDINEESLKIAEKNIEENNLKDFIKLCYQPDHKMILHNIIQENDFFFFTMCNPPYFSLEEEIKHDNPNTACEYNSKEVYCEGGEYQFINQMIEESENFKYNVLWFTTLIGKKITLDKILKILSIKENVKIIKKTTFYQGKLARWGLAWTYFTKEDLENILSKRKACEEKEQKVIPKEKLNFFEKIRFSHKKSKLKKINKLIKEI